LSNLARPDIASVYRDIHDPSVTINPNYVAYAVALKDGRVAQGIVRAEGADAIRVLDTEAKETVIRRSEIEELRPTSSSIMPAGLIGVLGDEKLRDLLAFLTAPPKEGEEKPKVGAENRR
jgi:putative heme-binding domain-containing protein